MISTRIRINEYTKSSFLNNHGNRIYNNNNLSLKYNFENGPFFTFPEIHNNYIVVQISTKHSRPHSFATKSPTKTTPKLAFRPWVFYREGNKHFAQNRATPKRVNLIWSGSHRANDTLDHWDPLFSHFAKFLPPLFPSVSYPSLPIYIYYVWPLLCLPLCGWGFHSFWR